MKTVKVSICVGTRCTMMGALDIYESVTEMQEEYQGQRIEVELVKCFGVCKSHDAPVVLVGDRRITSATSEKVMETIMEVGKA
jgi:NADH:ubiquinone oxidoreductase subunit E